MTKLSWQAVDEVLDSLQRHRLVPEGRRIVLDGACGPVMKEGLGYVLQLDKQRRFKMTHDLACGHLDRLESDLKGALESELRGIHELISEFMLRLPAGHELTPGTRINTIAFEVMNWTKLWGYDISKVVLDGTAPLDGEIARMFKHWMDKCPPIDSNAYRSWGLQMRRLLQANGFSHPLGVISLGMSLAEAGIKAGDPHTL